MDRVREILAAVAAQPTAVRALKDVSVCSPVPAARRVYLRRDPEPIKPLTGDDDRAVAALARAARGLYGAAGPIVAHKGRWTEPFGRTWVVTRA